MFGRDTGTTPKVRMLESVELFRQLPAKKRREAAALMDVQNFKDGEPVVMQGYHGEQFHVIVSGTAEVTRDGTHLATLEPGAFFGEAGLLDHLDRNATVRARGPLKTLTANAADFERLRALVPLVARRIDIELEARR